MCYAGRKTPIGMHCLRNRMSSINNVCRGRHSVGASRVEGGLMCILLSALRAWRAHPLQSNHHIVGESPVAPGIIGGNIGVTRHEGCGENDWDVASMCCVGGTMT